MKFLDDSLLKFDQEVATPEDAIRLAGGVLLEEGTIDRQYIEAMIQAYHENGPYFVLAPAIAIPHARPEDGVHEASVSCIHLKEPVSFGHQSNDPVKLIFGLGAASSQEHVELLRKLTRVLNNQEYVKRMEQASSFEEFSKIFRESDIT
ncbi:PTS sugar transporter subunit IIA [Thalassobacillus sp. CUG 92003]|uniref:PTS sugar transporter subunit IIA n=1 Tax=Thalassobacillus sp. CUG 92003 TaxID=2736641 RepID=UPI0015E76E43|nr:PTS sugar transporter subunit IIA [Thalassobacillus sp. CUG 92003]